LTGIETKNKGGAARSQPNEREDRRCNSIQSTQFASTLHLAPEAGVNVSQQ